MQTSWTIEWKSLYLSGRKVEMRAEVRGMRYEDWGTRYEVRSPRFEVFEVSTYNLQFDLGFSIYGSNWIYMETPSKSRYAIMNWLFNSEMVGILSCVPYPDDLNCI